MSPTLPHQLLIPSTWIAVAMGDSFLLKDMVWVMLADVACICVTASWFLRRVFPSLPVCWTVLLTAGYAVGGFSRPSTGSCSSWTMPPCSPCLPWAFTGW